MKATVIAPINLNGAPVEVGAEVDVDDNTFANLARKGKLTPAAEVAPQVEPMPEVENREDEINLSKRSKKTK